METDPGQTDEQWSATSALPGAISTTGDLPSNVIPLDSNGMAMNRENFNRAYGYVVLPEGCTGLGVPDPARCDYFTIVDPDSTTRIPSRFKSRTHMTMAVNTLFLNFDGADLTSSSFGDNATENESSVLGMQWLSSATIPPFEPSDYYELRDYPTRADQLHAVAGHVRRLFAPFDVDVVIERPRSHIPYTMIMVGGSPSLLNLPRGVLGVAPMDCGHTAKKSIAFVFPEDIHTTGLLASTIAHEAGHTYGLHHIDNTEGIMYPAAMDNDSYWEAGSTTDGRACDGSYHQDSYALLGENLGWRMLNGDPWVQFGYPGDGAVLVSLSEVFPITADESIVERVELRVNGITSGGADWFDLLMGVGGLEEGVNILELTGFDHPDHNGAVRTFTASIQVTIDPACVEEETCTEGKKAVGQPCSEPEECATALCAEDALTGIRVCSKPCSIANPCPWPVGGWDYSVHWTRCLCEDRDPFCCNPYMEDCSSNGENGGGGGVDCTDPEWADTEHCMQGEPHFKGYCGIGDDPLIIHRVKHQNFDAGGLKLEGCSAAGSSSSWTVFVLLALFGIISLRRRVHNRPV